MSLDINIELFEGEPLTMTYDHFSVGDADSNYTLSISGFSQLNDRLQADTFVEINNGMMFSTRDRDNDDLRWSCSRRPPQPRMVV